MENYFVKKISHFSALKHLLDNSKWATTFTKSEDSYNLVENNTDMVKVIFDIKTLVAIWGSKMKLCKLHQKMEDIPYHCY